MIRIDSGLSSFTFDYLSERYHLSWLPETVALHSTSHFQFFANPRSFTPVEVEKLFPDEETTRSRALLHRVGVTNKDRFKAGVDQIWLQHGLSATARNFLHGFIDSCDCAPPSVRSKLEALGYSDIAGRISFEDLHPEMRRSLDVIAHFKTIQP